jgi:AAA+ ATPase superfamily predicted ATPase
MVFVLELHGRHFAIIMPNESAFTSGRVLNNMSTPAEQTVYDTDAAIAALELCIKTSRIEDARKELRQLLISEARVGNSGATIGDALSTLADRPRGNSVAAILTLRCLAVQGLLPSANSSNQIIRSAVSLTQGALPEIITFLKIDTSRQNYEIFDQLATAHGRITALLSPLSLQYGDIDAVLAARKDIIGALSHSIIRQYAEPFRLKEIRSTVEATFSVLKKVLAQETSLLNDINECHRAIAQAKSEFEGAGTFLYFGYLSLFLDNCGVVLSNFLASRRARFATTIQKNYPGSELQKRYPLHEDGRVIQIVVPLRNGGPGIANSVTVSATAASSDIILGTDSIILGSVPPGEFSVTLDVMVMSPCEQLTVLLQVEWGEIGTPDKKSEVFEFRVIAQARSIKWHELEYWAPYSTAPVEGDKFVGRSDKIQQLASKLLRDPMEPFYITGQKRVGKTSLALAAAEFAKAKNGALRSHYVLWGSVAHVDPQKSLKALGESIERFIATELPPGIVLAGGDYSGSLADLIKYSDAVLKLVPERRFVLVLDEFDEIHQELFLQGNLAETFFANLRALARCRNICLVLVGGENMPFIMDRQGQKLNNFSRFNLSYYSRTTEWDDFQLLVRKPSAGLLNWHDDAVSEVFNSTNGNPYFSSIVCGGVLRTAVSERDADITSSEVKRAIEGQVSSLGAHSFAHLWQDGIPKSTSEKDPDILRRMRTLVAMARCLRKGISPTASNIANEKTSTQLSDSEVPAVLNDFVRRDVLKDELGSYYFSLPIFGMWLVDVGVSQLVADKLNEELANVAVQEENANVVKSEEVVELSKKWPTFRGRHIGTDEIRTWYQQVELVRDQRILFELLKRTKFYSETLVRERLRDIQTFLRPGLPEFIIRKSSDRRNDVLVTFVDGEGKSGASYASLYAEENRIAADSVVSRGNLKARIAERIENGIKPAMIVIVDDIAGTGRSLAENVERFCIEFKNDIAETKIRVVTLVATAEAQSVISDKLKTIEADIEFRSCEILPHELYAFPKEDTVWKTAEQEARAKALCVDLGARIYRRNPLGYGDLGLLVVFPTTVPNNSLPILHSHSRTGSAVSWSPLFPRLVN